MFRTSPIKGLAAFALGLVIAGAAAAQSFPQDRHDGGRLTGPPVRQVQPQGAMHAGGSTGVGGGAPAHVGPAPMVQPSQYLPPRPNFGPPPAPYPAPPMAFGGGGFHHHHRHHCFDRPTWVPTPYGPRQVMQRVCER